MIFNTNYNPDVLSCLANLSNDEVFTPPNLVNQMLDTLPQELFQSKKTTFLDPVTKSGVFLREIAKRLNTGLENEIPDRQERLNHIFTKQLFGIAITELTALLARRSLYCTKKANSDYSICNDFETEEGNIKFERMLHSWKNGVCIFCGANEEKYKRGDQLETHAYEFIHTDEPKNIFNMRFDVIIGNPPYQLSDGGSGMGTSAIPLYDKFVTQAIKLNPRYLSMIIPSRWFAGGRGLSSFRESMLNDKRVQSITDFMSSKECFPGVNIAGGVCYFLWNRDYNGDCEITNVDGGKKDTIKRKLNQHNVLIRSNLSVGIIEKVLKKKCDFLNDFVFESSPFGFRSFARGKDKPFKNSIVLLTSAGNNYVDRDAVKRNIDQIDKYKVIIGKVVPSNGEVDVTPEIGYKVTTTPKVLHPGVINSETYLLLSVFNNENEAVNFSEYFSLKMPRFLLKQTLSSMNISQKSFQFVPKLDAKIKWTDKMLFDFFNLSSNEANYIDSIIRPMQLENEQ